MKKVIFLLILQFLGIKTIAQSILLDPKKSSSSILELNSNEADKAGIRFKQLSNTLEEADIYLPVPSAIGVVYSSTDKSIYVNSFTHNKVIRIPSSGPETDLISTGLNGPQDIILSPDNLSLYISNFHAGSISKYTISGVFVSSLTGFSNPTGLTFDNNGNLFVANNGNGTISKVAVGGVITHNFITGLSNPYGIVYDPLTNKIFISNYSANEIAEANATTGGAKSTFKANIEYCTGITRNSYGDLIVAQSGLNKIVFISSNGEVRNLITDTVYPLDVAIDNADNVYTANQTLNRIKKYQPNYEINSLLLTLDIYGNLKKANFDSERQIKFNSSIIAKHPNGNYGMIGSDGVRGYSVDYTPAIIGTATQVNAHAGLFFGLVRVNGGVIVSGPLDVYGNVCAANLSCPSDFTLKRDITPLRSSLQKLCNIGSYNYYWKDSTQNKGLQTGVIAQELQKILPELVNEDKDKKLSVNYIGLIPHLIEAIKELKNENEDLKAKIKQYDNRFDAIEAALKQQLSSLK